jgi:hypothetical protein
MMDYQISIYYAGGRSTNSSTYDTPVLSSGVCLNEIRYSFALLVQLSRVAPEIMRHFSPSQQPREQDLDF